MTSFQVWNAVRGTTSSIKSRHVPAPGGVALDASRLLHPGSCRRQAEDACVRHAVLPESGWRQRSKHLGDAVGRVHRGEATRLRVQAGDSRRSSRRPCRAGGKGDPVVSGTLSREQLQGDGCPEQDGGRHQPAVDSSTHAVPGRTKQVKCSPGIPAGCGAVLRARLPSAWVRPWSMEMRVQDNVNSSHMNCRVRKGDDIRQRRRGRFSPRQDSHPMQ